MPELILLAPDKVARLFNKTLRPTKSSSITEIGLMSLISWVCLPQFASVTDEIVITYISTYISTYY
ncbi:hypothetical protein [Pseudoalteromonas pernae]|uniref:hypothetical protein n=1 Tax=Pseudoalteromonas pernae TaxID=3118054 RepID=UPI0032425BB7